MMASIEFRVAGTFRSKVSNAIISRQGIFTSLAFMRTRFVDGVLAEESVDVSVGSRSLYSA